MIEKSNTQVITAECPSCMSKIRFHQSLQLGQLVTCPECKKQLQVEQAIPLELGWVFDKNDSDDEETYYQYR